VKGRRVRIELADDQGKTDEAVAAVRRLIDEKTVAAILGADSSTHSIAMAAIAQARGVPMITPSSTHPQVTETGDYIFRVCFIDPFQGAVMARFAREDLKAKKVSILRDVKNEYSVGLADFFKEKFVSLGGQVVSVQAYAESGTDAKGQLAAIRAAKPDLIYLPGYYTDAGMIVRQARAMGIQAAFAGGDGWDAEKLFEIGGEALEGSYFTNHYSPEGNDPVLRAFVETYRKKYNAVPDSGVALSFDAATLLFDAMGRAAQPRGAALRDAIAATKNFPGVTGSITLDARRNAQKPAVILRIEKGRTVYVKTVQP
jgi:branched-chain amino acid transport system substrate-binding protein